ncbi:MAG: GNAT family N-acetyltransferase [Planctomycetota bacterium]|jgi:GNAT superfamily N-acetyltransferase
MKNQIHIRIAVKNDLPAMVELWKEMMDFHKERDQFFTRTATGPESWIESITDHIAKESSCVLVAERDGRIVGHCLGFVSEYPPVLTISHYGLFQELAVAANYRRCGVGQSLFNEMLEWFRGRGIKRAEVRVSVHNELSVAFWRKMGLGPYIETLFLEI